VSFLDEQVEVVADTLRTDVILLGSGCLGTQDSKLDVFFGVTIIEGRLKILYPELFPRRDNLDIGTGYQEHPQVISKIGSVILKVCFELFKRYLREGGSGTGGGVFLADRGDFVLWDRNFCIYRRLGLVLGLGFGFLRSRLTTLITCVCNCICNS
jgi:hypothetical protein